MCKAKHTLISFTKTLMLRAPKLAPSAVGTAQPLPPMCSGPPRQQRFLPGSHISSRFFTTFERQTVEVAPENKTAHQGVKPKTPTQQTQTRASHLRSGRNGAANRAGSSQPCRSLPSSKTSFSSNERAGGSVPFARQHIELNFHPTISRQAQQRRVGAGEEGRRQRKQGGWSRPHSHSLACARPQAPLIQSRRLLLR